MAWHVLYKAEDGETWQFDIIHIEDGTEYDGFFEKMADRIVEVITPQQREAILRLKLRPRKIRTIMVLNTTKQ